MLASQKRKSLRLRLQNSGLWLIAIHKTCLSSVSTRSLLALVRVTAVAITTVTRMRALSGGVFTKEIDAKSRVEGCARDFIAGKADIRYFAGV